MSDSSSRLQRVQGRAIPVRGHDIDTDRIVPARYLKAITFEGLEEGAFTDDRKQLAKAGQVHPFDDPRYAGAKVLLVNRNFGCGSSREHAPQALRRWGIRAIVGESFSEIFFGNALALGIPCVRVTSEHAAQLMAAVEDSAETLFVVDLEAMTVSAGSLTVPIELPASARDALITGRWDATALLREGEDEVRATAARLPYLSGFATG